MLDGYETFIREGYVPSQLVLVLTNEVFSSILTIDRTYLKACLQGGRVPRLSELVWGEPTFHTLLWKTN